MIKQEIEALDLRQPSHQIKYAQTLNGIQEELCSLIESHGSAVTPDASSPWNQLSTSLKALQNKAKSFHLELSREDNDRHKNRVIRIDSFSLLNAKARSASFLLKAEIVNGASGRIYSVTERCYVLYSHRINRWYFSCSNLLGISPPQYDSLDMTPAGFLLSRCGYVLIKGRKIVCRPIGSPLKESRFFFDDSGSPCIALAQPDEFHLKSISILNWRIIV